MHHAALLLAACLASLPLHARTLVLNVATNGNDGWSGEISMPTFDGRDGPLATVATALRRAREARRHRWREVDGVTILIRKGAHYLEEPITITPADSGLSAEDPLLIAAYPNETPILSGGKRITGWQCVESDPHLWRADVPEARNGRSYFRQLFVDGRRRQRARTPNRGFLRMEGPSPTADSPRFKFAAGALDSTWEKPSGGEVVALVAWASLQVPIRSVNAAERTVTLVAGPKWSYGEKDARFYVENVSAALDEPGEWYLDSSTGTVTYWPHPWEDMTHAEVIAPGLERLLELRGSAEDGNPVRHVVLRGIAFAYTDWTMGPDGYSETQSAAGISGDVYAEAAVDCVIEDCLLTRLGGYALELGRGCQRWRVVGNEFFELAAGGIRVGETVKRTGAFERNYGNVISDNRIRDGGRVYPGAAGILVLQSGNNRVAFNEVYNLNHTGISVGWNWGYETSPCHDNTVEFNHVHDVGRGMLNDVGGIYMLGPQKGTVVRNNLVHDVTAFSEGGRGLYLDEGSAEIALEENVVYRCSHAGFYLHAGRNIVLRNNIIALNGEHQLVRVRAEPHISFNFTQNIVYFDAGELLGGNWSNDNFRMTSNVYYDARPEARPETMRFAGATIEEWRKRGHDLDSVVGNPLFYSPRQFNFRLNLNSPALGLGFRPVNLNRVGVRRKEDRI